MGKILVRNEADPSARTSAGQQAEGFEEYVVEIDDDAVSVEMARAHGFLPCDPEKLTPTGERKPKQEGEPQQQPKPEDVDKAIAEDVSKLVEAGGAYQEREDYVAAQMAGFFGVEESVVRAKYRSAFLAAGGKIEDKPAKTTKKSKGAPSADATDAGNAGGGNEQQQ